MDRTGHRDVKCLHAYQRESGREREAVSDVLQNSKCSFLEGSTPKNVKTECQEGKYTSTIVRLSLKWIENNARNFNQPYSIFLAICTLSVICFIDCISWWTSIVAC